MAKWMTDWRVPIPGRLTEPDFSSRNGNLLILHNEMQNGCSMLWTFMGKIKCPLHRYLICTVSPPGHPTESTLPSLLLWKGTAHGFASMLWMRTGIISQILQNRCLPMKILFRETTPGLKM